MVEPTPPSAPGQTIRHRRLAIVIGVAGLAVIGGVLLFSLRGSGGGDSTEPTSPADAFAQITDGRDVTSVGSLGDIADPESLRRRLQRLLDSGDSVVPISDEAAAEARACWRRTDPGPRGDLGLLVGQATFGGELATLLAVSDRGRVVAFVVDEQCQVVAAQSI